MSGGSFGYLCFADVTELGGRLETIGAMADLLEGLDDGKLAARYSRDVIRLLIGAERVAQSLSDVWHAAEWWKSGDSGEDRLHDALAKFAPWPPAPDRAPAGGEPG